MKVRTGSGKVHLAEPAKTEGWVVLACSGRLATDTFPAHPDTEPTCGACRRRVGLAAPRARYDLAWAEAEYQRVLAEAQAREAEEARLDAAWVAAH